MAAALAAPGPASAISSSTTGRTAGPAADAVFGLPRDRGPPHQLDQHRQRVGGANLPQRALSLPRQRIGRPPAGQCGQRVHRAGQPERPHSVDRRQPQVVGAALDHPQQRWLGAGIPQACQRARSPRAGSGGRHRPAPRSAAERRAGHRRRAASRTAASRTAGTVSDSRAGRGGREESRRREQQHIQRGQPDVRLGIGQRSARPPPAPRPAAPATGAAPRARRPVGGEAGGHPVDDHRQALRGRPARPGCARPPGGARDRDRPAPRAAERGRRAPVSIGRKRSTACVRIDRSRDSRIPRGAFDHPGPGQPRGLCVQKVEDQQRRPGDHEFSSLRAPARQPLPEQPNAASGHLLRCKLAA